MYLNIMLQKKLIERGSFKVVFRNMDSNGLYNIITSEQVSEQVKYYRKLVLDFCVEPKSAKEIRQYLNIKSRNYANNKVIKPLIRDNRLDYTNKNHINASNPKYITKQ